MIEALVAVPVIPEPGKVDGCPETPRGQGWGLAESRL
jgi:hypothetical protein